MKAEVYNSNEQYKKQETDGETAITQQRRTEQP